MKFALLCEDLGVPQTLATTSFVLSIADGLTRAGSPVRIVGLTPRESGWCAESVAPFESVAPWLAPPAPDSADELEALRRGISVPAEDDDAPGTFGPPEWYRGLLLQRALEDFAAGDKELVLVVFPINFGILQAAADVARRMGIKVVVQSCEAMSRPWIDPATRADYIRCVVENSDGVWALSRFLAGYWIDQGVPGEKVLVHPSITRVEQYPSTRAPEDLSAVYLGNLQHKEIDHLLEVASIVVKEVPGFTLTIHGDATPEQRAAIAGRLAERGLERVVRLVDSHWSTPVPRMLAAADVLLLPRAADAFSEASFPNKLGEYLASGRPVVVTAVGDIPLYVTDRQDALLVEPDDVEAFAAAVIDVLTDADLARRLAVSGRTLAEQLFDSRAVARKIEEFVGSLPARRPVRQTARQRWTYLRAALSRRGPATR